MCNKRKHATTYGAAKHITELCRKQRRARRKPFGIYYCGICDAYHITSRASNTCIAMINN